MRKRPRRSHGEWCQLIGEQEAGERSVAGFCRERSLAVQSFYYHRQRMRQDKPGRGFCEVALPRSSGVRVMVEAAGCRIEVERGFDPDCLREVVQALR